jgi:hypothetical protein
VISCSRRMAYFLATCTAILLLASAMPPAAGSYFKDQSFPEAYEYSLYSSPLLMNCTLPGLTVTELSDTDFIVTVPGDIINVSLAETDPHLNWEFVEGDGVQYVGNSLRETYPVRHQFMLKVNNSCTVRFKMIDDRDGKAIKTFEVSLVVARPLSGLGWPALSLDIVPSFGWPVRLKF